MKRELRPDIQLAENVRTLLRERGIDDSALAIWCGHKPAWISKILSGERRFQLKEIGRVADFFGLTPSQILQNGISHLTERRHAERRTLASRRTTPDRRQPAEIRARVHRDVDPFPKRSPERKRVKADVLRRVSLGELKPEDIDDAELI